MSGAGGNGIAQDQIKAFVERIVRLKQEGADRETIRTVYAEALAAGFDKSDIGIRVKIEAQVSQGWTVYFVAFRRAKMLKIGISRDPASRVSSLSRTIGESGEILLTFPGFFALEGWYHAAFNPWRLTGEWFALNDETLAAVETIRRKGPAIRMEAA